MAKNISNSLRRKEADEFKWELNQRKCLPIHLVLPVLPAFGFQVRAQKGSLYLWQYPWRLEKSASMQSSKYHSPELMRESWIFQTV